MSVIDAHQHVWDLSRVSYPWLGPGSGLLNRSYRIEELEPELRQCGVDGTVLVQAADSVEETRWMQHVADGNSLVRAIVGWAPLTDPKATAQILEDYARDPRIVGIRHLVQNEADEDWLVRPDVHESLAVLADKGFTLDVVAVTERHLRNATRVAQGHPNLKVVIDHLGKPPISDKGWSPWAEAIAEAAAQPRMHAKISGLNTAAGEGWKPEDLEPYFQHSLQIFGPDRLMYGGDWPVTLLNGRYTRVWIAVTSLIEHLAPSERAWILGGTAEQFYGLTFKESPARMSTKTERRQSIGPRGGTK